MASMPRVIVIGLDCLAPELAFSAYADRMPRLSELRARGGWGRLRSVTPPITVPAWSCALTSRDPGALGVYGFRNRGSWGYGDRPGDHVIATSQAILAPRAFEQIAAEGRRAVCLSVPGTFPPPKHPHLDLVSCFLAPVLDQKAVSSPAFLDRLRSVSPDYQIDVRDFRSDEKDHVVAQCRAMMAARFDAAVGLIQQTPNLGFFMMVEIGTDRMHHALWSVCRPEHPRYQPGTRWANALSDYYAQADDGIGRILDALRPDDAVFVVSDHGARSLYGGVCVNEWLIAEGYLVLKEPVAEPNTKLKPGMVDWSRTRAWGDGGYYARIFLNMAGREPAGIVPADQYETLRAEIAAKAESLDLASLVQLPEGAAPPRGRTRAWTCQQLYPEVRGFPPDLQIFWGDLDFRSIGTLGWGRLVIEHNDSGPDEANHDWDGVYVGAGPGLPTGELQGLSLLDLGPTFCALASAPPLPDAQGRCLLQS